MCKNQANILSILFFSLANRQVCSWIKFVRPTRIHPRKHFPVVKLSHLYVARPKRQAVCSYRRRLSIMNVLEYPGVYSAVVVLKGRSGVVLNIEKTPSKTSGGGSHKHSNVLKDKCPKSLLCSLKCHKSN